MICKQCRGTRIKSRQNYSHGKKSGATTTLICKDCGSHDIQGNPNTFNRRGNNRR
jgi:RNase P subunit RPR2